MLLTWKHARRVIVFVVGMTVLLFGVSLIVLPGPAIVVIPVGLAILATEFVWARRLFDKVKDKARAFPVVFEKKPEPPSTDNSPADPASKEDEDLTQSRGDAE